MPGKRRPGACGGSFVFMPCYLLRLGILPFRFEGRLNTLTVILVPTRREKVLTRPMIASRRSRAIKSRQIPTPKKVSPQMAIPARCTLVAFAEPFQSRPSTLLLLTMAFGQRVFCCLRSASSSTCARKSSEWGWSDFTYQLYLTLAPVILRKPARARHISFMRQVTDNQTSKELCVVG